MENTKYNICLVNDSFPPLIDGVANVVCNYASIINRSLGNATVVTPYYPDADDSRFPYQVVRYPSVEVGKSVGYRAGLPFSSEVLGELTDKRFDIIHTHCPIASTFLARTLRERTHAPIVFTYHTKFDIDIANAIHGHLLQEGSIRILAENISACDEVWTVSRGAGENLRSLGYEGEYSVMPNGVDLPRGKVSEAAMSVAAADYDLPNDVPLFLFVGRMMWYKGIRLILDALSMLQKDGKDFRMVFVGGGVDRAEIVAYSRSLHLDSKVFFIEPIHDRELIRAWYSRADLFLFPSTFDTNGLVVHEAAAASLPSVLVAGSCAAEDVTDGVNGFLMEENAASLHALLLRLLAHRDTVRQVGENACRDLYCSWEESVAAAYDRYGAVIENYRAGRYPRRNTLGDNTIRAVSRQMAIHEKAKSELLTVKNDLELETELLTDAMRGEQERMRRLLEAVPLIKKEDIRQKFERFL